MPTTTDLIGLAIDKNPMDFADTLNQLMMQRAADHLETYKVDLAKDLYGASEVEPEDESNESDFDDAEDSDDIDVDLEDFEDLDLDDIDLEDLADGDE